MAQQGDKLTYRARTTGIRVIDDTGGVCPEIHIGGERTEGHVDFGIDKVASCRATSDLEQPASILPAPSPPSGVTDACGLATVPYAVFRSKVTELNTKELTARADVPVAYIAPPGHRTNVG